MIMGDLQSVYTIILICVISSILIRKLYKSSRANSRLPPTPFGLPIIGHLHLLAPIAHQALHKLSLKYGPVFRFSIGSTPCIVVSSPDTAKEMFKEHEDAFLDKPHISTVDHVTYGGQSFIFAPYGSYWKFMKKITMSQLLNSSTLDFLMPVRRDEINQLIKYVSQQAKDGKPVETEPILGHMTSNMVSRMVTGNMYSEKDEKVDSIKKIMVDIRELYGKFNLSDHIWFLKNLDVQGIRKTSSDIRRRFDVLMERIFREHQEGRKQNKETAKVKDLLNILLEISDDENKLLSNEKIKALILEMFLAGTDTSSRTIEWGLSELINHPNIMKKAVEEIDRVVGKNRLLQESDIPNLPYLQEIVKETLRLHPAAPLFQRLSTKDCTLGGYHIPAKTTVFINLWSIGRDPAYWESPLEFRPERFEDKQTDLRGQHFHLLPFGSGKRMCPGISLGLMFVHMTLGSLIHCFTWKPAGSSLDMEEGIGVTLLRAKPLVCVPTARLDLDALSL